jgi:hypothetical protein
VYRRIVRAKVWSSDLRGQLDRRVHEHAGPEGLKYVQAGWLQPVDEF